MNTDNANKYLDAMQINDRSVWDSKDIKHPLDCILEDYHQEQLHNELNSFQKKRIDLLNHVKSELQQETNDKLSKTMSPYRSDKIIFLRKIINMLT
jgi:hypothetical protein